MVKRRMAQGVSALRVEQLECHFGFTTAGAAKKKAASEQLHDLFGAPEETGTTYRAINMGGLEPGDLLVSRPFDSGQSLSN
jgi:hypothetical protein